MDSIREMEWDKKLVNDSYLGGEVECHQTRQGLPLNSAVKDAFSEYTVDHLEGTKISASTIDNNGRRHTAADLLQYANPDNIVVLLNATATRILFDSSSGKVAPSFLCFSCSNIGLDSSFPKYLSVKTMISLFIFIV